MHVGGLAGRFLISEPAINLEVPPQFPRSQSEHREGTFSFLTEGKKTAINARVVSAAAGNAKT